MPISQLTVEAPEHVCHSVDSPVDQKVSIWCRTSKTMSINFGFMDSLLEMNSTLTCQKDVFYKPAHNWRKTIVYRSNLFPEEAVHFHSVFPIFGMPKQEKVKIRFSARVKSMDCWDDFSLIRLGQLNFYHSNMLLYYMCQERS